MTVLSHKGYQGSATYEDGTIVVQVLHIDDLITASCDNAGDVEATFQELVDDYLQTCSELGREPQKPYKGSLNVRLAPELHRDAVMAATASAKSLNAWIVEAIEQNLKLDAKPTEILPVHLNPAKVAWDFAWTSLSEFESSQFETKKLGSNLEKGPTQPIDIRSEMQSAGDNGISEPKVLVLTQYREKRRA